MQRDSMLATDLLWMVEVGQKASSSQVVKSILFYYYIIFTIGVVFLLFTQVRLFT